MSHGPRSALYQDLSSMNYLAAADGVGAKLGHSMQKSYSAGLLINKNKNASSVPVGIHGTIATKQRSAYNPGSVNDR
jgi:hypothetical protein